MFKSHLETVLGCIIHIDFSNKGLSVLMFENSFFCCKNYFRFSFMVFSTNVCTLQYILSSLDLRIRKNANILLL